MEINNELRKLLSLFYTDLEIELIKRKFHIEIEKGEKMIKEKEDIER